MNSETLIAVIGLFCFFLMIAFFHFIKPQFFILLNRLAQMEPRDARNQKPKVEIIAPKETGQWPWYKAWASTLFHPTVSTGKVLLSEGHISFRQTLIWLMVVSALAQLTTSAIPFIKNPDIITAKSVFNLILSCLLAGVISPISVIILTAGVHLFAKLFRGKGTWNNYFIVWVAFNAPILILFFLFAFVYQVFAIKDSLIFGSIISFYWLFVVNPMAIKSTYSIGWFGSCLIYFFVTVMFFVCFMGLFVVFDPGLITR